MNKIVKNTLILTLITVIAGFLLGAVYEITKDPIAKQEAQLQHLEGFLNGIKKKLSNTNFVAHAPESVVALERKKQSDSEEKIASIKESLAALKKK